MAFLDEFNSAVKDYCKNNVTLKITNVEAAKPGEGSSININETWKGKIQVQNTGLLNIKGVKFHIVGQSYSAGGVTNPVKVCKTLDGNFVNEIDDFDSLNVNSNSPPQTTDYFYFKAPGKPSSGSVPLVKVHIGTFDVDLDNILITNTGHSDPPAGTYSAPVYPNK